MPDKLRSIALDHGFQSVPYDGGIMLFIPGIDAIGRECWESIPVKTLADLRVALGY